jgi:hypothetical protein
MRHAGVVELVDTPALGAGGLTALEVRVLSPALAGYPAAEAVSRAIFQPAFSGARK